MRGLNREVYGVLMENLKEETAWNAYTQLGRKVLKLM